MVSRETYDARDDVRKSCLAVSAENNCRSGKRGHVPLRHRRDQDLSVPQQNRYISTWISRVAYRESIQNLEIESASSRRFSPELESVSLTANDL